MATDIELGPNAEVVIDEDAGTLIITVDTDEIDVSGSDLTGIGEVDCVDIVAEGVTTSVDVDAGRNVILGNDLQGATRVKMDDGPDPYVWGLMSGPDYGIGRFDGTDFFADVEITTGQLEVDNIVTTSLDNQDYNEAVETIDPSGATETLDLANANYFDVVLGDNTDFSFTATGSAGNSFIVFLEQDSTGGRTPTWPSAVEWPGGGSPDAPADDGNVRLVFETPDGGTTWRGAEAGRDFA